MWIQFSTTENYSSSPLVTGLRFEAVPEDPKPIDPPDNQGGGEAPTPPGPNAPIEEETPEA